MILTDESAYQLIHENKKFITSSFPFPDEGGKVNLIGSGLLSKTEFLVDINRSSMMLEKITMQERVYQAIPLLRIDLDTKPHHNPDDTMISGNHLHVYREKYGSSFAYELYDPTIKKMNPSVDLEQLLAIQNARERFKIFTQFCHFINEPIFADAEEDQLSLF